jgi:hypothetical protein
MHGISHLKITRSKKLQDSVRNMHCSINPEEFKTEIYTFRHIVTNIWNIKQYRTKLQLSIFFVELKPAANNKDIFTFEGVTEGRTKELNCEK